MTFPCASLIGKVQQPYSPQRVSRSSSCRLVRNPTPHSLKALGGQPKSRASVLKWRRGAVNAVFIALAQSWLGIGFLGGGAGIGPSKLCLWKKPMPALSFLWEKAPSETLVHFTMPEEGFSEQ